MTTTYEEIRPTLKTGDLVFFSGKSKISALIKMVTRSSWSHIGMVYVMPYDQNSVHGEQDNANNFVGLFESAKSGKRWDRLTGTSRVGVRIVSLSNRIQTYSGSKIGIRRLEHFKDTGPDYTELQELKNELRGRKYEQSTLELFNAVMDIWEPLDGNEEDLSSIFCSELVAEAYQRMGLLENEPPSNEYTPADFTRSIKLEKGSLSKMQRITQSSS